MSDQLATLEVIAEELRTFGDDLYQGGAALHGFADRITAAIALMRGQSWKPIETAPKDRRILLFQGGVWKGGWDEYERKWIGAGADVFIVPPTHWMDIPAPPQQEPAE